MYNNALLSKNQNLVVSSRGVFRILTWRSLSIKVHIFLEGHKILRNLHQIFDWHYIGQILGGDFAKVCGLLRIYELKKKIIAGADPDLQ